MNPYTKTLKESPEKTIYTSGINEYIEYNKKIMMFPEKISIKIPALKEEYSAGITSIINYLRSTLTEFRIDNKDSFGTNINPLELDLQSMFAECPNILINLIRNQNPPEIINIIDNQHMPHIHLSGETIEMAEHLELLPGLNRLLVNDRINKMFEGLNIFTAEALFKQMNLLPKNNNFERVLERYRERVILHRLLIKDIVDSLISTDSRYDIERARIFLSYFDVEYNPPKMNQSTSTPKKLEYKKNDC